MKEILPGIWSWSRFSNEKGYFFNGLLLEEGGRRILIDPPALPLEQSEKAPVFSSVQAIYLTNKDHERNACELRREWKIPLWIHELDKPFLKEAPDAVFSEGQALECGIRVVHLKNQKSPGECAFYLEKRKVLIVGDALIGHPAGKVSLLPASKYEDIRKAEAGLRRLFSLTFDILLVGDGEPVLGGAQECVEKFFDEIT